MIRRPSAAFCSLLTAFIAGAGLRLWTLGFFEFKEEQFGNMLAGMDMPGRWFLVNHGIASTVGVPNGAGLFQIMGVWALLGARTPFAFAACGVVASIAAMVLFYRMLKRYGSGFARTGVWMLALLPSSVLLAANIWPHSYLGLLAVAILWLTTVAWERQSAVLWCCACGLTAWAGTVHLSAFFLLPGLAAVGEMMKLRRQIWAAAAGIGLVIVLPWLWHLCFQWDKTMYDVPVSKALWRIWSREFAGCFGGGWLSEYFADPVAPLAWIWSRRGGRVLLILAGGLPWIGVIRAGIALCRREEMPKIVSVAFALTWSVIMGYTLLQTRLYFFYFVIMMPALIVMAAYGWSRLRLAWLRRGITVLWCVAALGVSVTALETLRYPGGHPLEYGPHIGFWNRCTAELKAEQAVAPLCLDLAVEGPVGEKLSPHIVKYFLKPYHDPSGRPCRLTISYDPVRRCYEHRLVFAE
ncbi:MAG: hypothetical protein IJC73_06640 [Lentisphaeria bacterium]|nr:hypothetical protein [Lentisphaeria bacterium]